MAVSHGLFAGLSFDRKRFAKDIALFEGERRTRKEQDAAPVALREHHDSGSAQPMGSERESDAEEGPDRKMDEVERMALLRKRHCIHVSSQKVPAPLGSFSELSPRFGCSPELLSCLTAMGLKEPTPIQRQAIPILLEGQECFACAPTGSGKTLAYVIPIVHKLKKPSKEGVRALVLSPTRELAAQICREAKRAAAGSRLRVRVLTKAAARCNDLLHFPSCDVLVATPLRLSQLLGEQPKIDLSRVQFLVLDEADKLFEMGFLEQIDAAVAACCSPEVVRCLFSATLPETVEQLARTIMHDPARVVVGDRNSATSSVRQELKFVGSEEGKVLAMRQLIQQGVDPPVLVFVQSKERAAQLHRMLVLEEGVRGVGVIHADRTQSQRDAVVEDFRAGNVWMLIATDLLGRGMDFKGVKLVVNYDFPPDSASYIHRVGRTGRAGLSGRAVTFYTEEDRDSLRSVAHLISAAGTEVPGWMLALPKTRHRKRKRGSALGEGKGDLDEGSAAKMGSGVPDGVLEKPKRPQHVGGSMEGTGGGTKGARGKTRAGQEARSEQVRLKRQK